jgi:CRP/FNR family transcriptional regulator
MFKRHQKDMKHHLLHTPLFQNLPENDYAFLSEHSSEKSFKRDEVIFKSGEPAQTLYVVLSGQVKLYNIRSGSNKEEIVCLIHQNGHFCLAPLMSREISHMSAKALEDCDLIAIPRTTIEQLVDQSHTFAKNVIRSLAGKECDLCEQVCDLSLTSPKERLAKYLLEQFQLAGKPSFKLSIRQNELASHLGTVRENLSRNLAALKKAHIIEMKAGMIKILNELELKNIADRKQHEALVVID